MLEKLDELERKVGALLGLLERQGERIGALEEERDELVARLTSAEDQIDSLKKEKKSLDRRLADAERLKGDLAKKAAESAPLEEEVRERIRAIIERIERVETEISEGLRAANEEDA